MLCSDDMGSSIRTMSPWNGMDECWGRTWSRERGLQSAVICLHQLPSLSSICNQSSMQPVLIGEMVTFQHIVDLFLPFPWSAASKTVVGEKRGHIVPSLGGHLTSWIPMKLWMTMVLLFHKCYCSQVNISQSVGIPSTYPEFVCHWHFQISTSVDHGMSYTFWKVRPRAILCSVLEVSGLGQCQGWPCLKFGRGRSLRGPIVVDPKHTLLTHLLSSAILFRMKG